MLIQNSVEHVDNWNSVQVYLLVSDPTTVVVPEIGSSSVILKNSWKRKVGFIISTMFFSWVLVYNIGNFRANVESFFSLVFISGMLFLSLYQLLERKTIIEVDTEGITFKGYEVVYWDKIQYLYFKEVVDEETHSFYIVCLLKSGDEYEIAIEYLSCTREELGALLYAYMRKYGTR